MRLHRWCVGVRVPRDIMRPHFLFVRETIISPLYAYTHILPSIMKSTQNLTSKQAAGNTWVVTSSTCTRLFERGVSLSADGIPYTAWIPAVHDFRLVDLSPIPVHKYIKPFVVILRAVKKGRQVFPAGIQRERERDRGAERATHTAVAVPPNLILRGGCHTVYSSGPLV